MLSNSRSAALVALRCFLSDELPMNAGIERCVRVTCLPGRVTNPELPAAGRRARGPRRPGERGHARRDGAGPQQHPGG
ncbi:hydantoinase B/oxoprolinase family protein [Nonomuraea ferruginea]